MEHSCLAVLVAAGEGARLGRPEGKVRVALAGRPLYMHSLATIMQVPGVRAVAVVVRAQDREAVELEIRDTYGAGVTAGPDRPQVVVASGGPSRQASVRCGLRALARPALPGADPPPAHPLALVHDAARPLASGGLYALVLAAAARSPGRVVAPATAVTDALQRETPQAADGGAPCYAPADRRGLWQVQTPQAGWFGELLAAHEAAAQAGAAYDDELAVGRAAGLAVELVPGERANVKVTLPEDLELVSRELRAGREPRVGIGFDVHPLVAGDGVRLGGVTVPAAVSLDGHSDADAAAHALADAILGAAGAGDIGMWFPPGDEQWRGADSAALLARMWRRLAGRGWLFGNADLVIAAEAPRLSPHYPAMRAALAAALAVEPDRISVKATTTECLGFVGRREGIAAMATVLLWRADARRPGQ
jgi:2-C-methyl-D-erythritol 4-phosphate cytidylyltransferase/2-C-methyl-D-erythritol 2,4-cyclodiphosphate synthase